MIAHCLFEQSGNIFFLIAKFTKYKQYNNKVCLPLWVSDTAGIIITKQSQLQSLPFRKRSGGRK